MASQTEQSFVRSYGIKERNTPTTPAERQFEELSVNGFVIVDAGLDAAERDGIADAFDRALKRLHDVHGAEALREIDEHNTIRAPLALEEAFIGLAQNRNVLDLAELVFRGRASDGAFILNQQNGIANPPRGEKYNQGAWHRDLPYQHFVSTRPLAINALYCIDPFALENGATLVARGTHRYESFPSEAFLASLAEPVCAPAGSFLVLDCMLFHSGGVNTSDAVRRAVNHVYTLPFIRQQIDLPTTLGEHQGLSPATRRLLGFGNETVANPADYYRRRAVKLQK